MPFIMEDYEKGKDYIFCFVHQNDERPFNRGALKNIGFMYYKEKYPDDYKNIQFIFHDIDTIPYTKEVWNYETEPGIVKHFYGYKHALGGIFTIYGSDFEKTNGFPCLWSWGFEDNIIQKRVIKNNLKIDRSQFYTIQSKEILQFFDGYKREMTVESVDRGKNYTNHDGISTLNEIDYVYDEENEMIQVYNFKTLLNTKNEHFLDYDLNNGNNFTKSKLNSIYNSNRNKNNNKNNNVKNKVNKNSFKDKLLFTTNKSL
tara:strand:- start:306 stop:1079 length:774 start_codon:yes stop_codon:yes gene_type:complete